MLKRWRWSTVLLLGCSLSAARAQDLEPTPAIDQNAEIQVHIQRVREALAKNDLVSSSREYAEILKLDPKNSEINAALGVTLYGLGKPTEAAAALKNALRLDPTLANAEMFLGLSESALGRCDQGVPLLSKHFDERTEPKLRRLVGLALLNCDVASSKLDDALGVAHNLRQFYPKDPDVLYNLAELYTRLWDITADDLMRAHPDSYRVHQLAGEVLEAQGRLEQAIKEYGMALKENNKIPGLHYRIGRLLLQQGQSADRQKAMDYFQQELVVNSGDAASEYSIGEIYQEDRRFGAAEEHYRRALKLAPDFAEAHLGLAKALLAEKEPEKSVHELEEAIRLNPNDPSPHYTLMMAYRDLGRSDDAGREMTIFQKLRAEKAADFNSRLRTLLKGKADVSDESR